MRPGRGHIAGLLVTAPRSAACRTSLRDLQITSSVTIQYYSVTYMAANLPFLWTGLGPVLTNDFFSAGEYLSIDQSRLWIRYVDIFLVSCSGMRLSPLGRSATNWPIVPAPDDRWIWSIWWNENWHGNRNVLQCHCIHHKSHMTWRGLEPGPPRWDAGD
jgi:hypothetical protein